MKVKPTRLCPFCNKKVSQRAFKQHKQRCVRKYLDTLLRTTKT